MLKAVIFDMDGVIVDTEPQHLRALVKAGALYGANYSYDYCIQFIGRHITDTLNIIMTDFPQITNAKEFGDKYNELKIQVRDDEGLIPIEGTINLIRSLPSHGIKVAIASSSEPHEIHHVIEALGLSDYIDEAVSGSYVKRSKPEPDIFLLAAKQLGVTPDECIIIEDSMNGTIAATKAGIPCIGFQNKNSGNQDLSRACCVYEDMMALDYPAVLEEYNRVHRLPVEILTTDRLILRELSTADIPKLHSMYEDESLTKYIPSLLTLEEELQKHEAYIDHVYNFYRFGLWGVFLKESNELIGRAGLQCIDIEDASEVELGYLIDTDHQGNGYAKESIEAILAYAKEYLALPSVVAIIHPDNLRSIHLAKLAGFTLEKEIQTDSSPLSLYRRILA